MKTRRRMRTRRRTRRMAKKTTTKRTKTRLSKRRKRRRMRIACVQVCISAAAFMEWLLWTHRPSAVVNIFVLFGSEVARRKGLLTVCFRAPLAAADRNINFAH